MKAIHISSRLLGSETETISCDRPRRGIPEFDKVLRKAEKLLTLTVERLHRATRGCAQLRVESLDSTNEHIGIDCNHLALTLRFGGLELLKRFP